MKVTFHASLILFIVAVACGIVAVSSYVEMERYFKFLERHELQSSDEVARALGIPTYAEAETAAKKTKYFSLSGAVAGLASWGLARR